MFRKATFKKINFVIQWSVTIALAGGIYYFFINKNAFTEIHMLITWGAVGIINAGSIIDSKYFKENFSWKNNWIHIIQVSVSAVFAIYTIKKLWF